MPDEPSPTSGRTIGGIVLAAGTSSRFEPGNKLLEVVDGQPLVRHATETACASSLHEILVIVGYESEAVRRALSGLPVSIHHNDAFAEGQSTSVRRGTALARSKGWDAAVYLLGDMPFVRPSTIDRLLAWYTASDGTIVVPRYAGTRGNPVLFDSEHFEALESVSGDRGGRDIIANNPRTVFVDTADAGVRKDIDTATDLEEYSGD